MLIYWLSKLLLLISQLQHVIPYLEPVFAVLVLIGWGAWAKVLVSLYFMVMTCNTIDSLIMKLIWLAFPVWSSLLYFGRYIMEVLTNYTSLFFPPRVVNLWRTHSLKFPAPPPDYLQHHLRVLKVLNGLWVPLRPACSLWSGSACWHTYGVCFIHDDFAWSRKLSRVGFGSCLGLKDDTGGSRDFLWGWTVMNGRVCGIAWASN